MARLPFPRRVVLVLFLVVILAAPAILGAQPRPHAEDPRTHVTASVWDLGERLWRFLAGLWEKEGCIIDPHGGCTKGMTPKTDAGCILDPHGGCSGGNTGTTVLGDEGCILDPHGGCSQ